ncbi:MAG: hypothetical protein GF388_11020 [Candidatus Aegiribacteria sp.]|nr:hypothetical protein [Candidatus Aegiribacteria sp.]MBD3295530.1 hypothetical protein [Candidatus Fermentibacteria bacterium]
MKKQRKSGRKVSKPSEGSRAKGGKRKVRPDKSRESKRRKVDKREKRSEPDSREEKLARARKMKKAAARKEAAERRKDRPEEPVKEYRSGGPKDRPEEMGHTDSESYEEASQPASGSGGGRGCGCPGCALSILTSLAMLAALLVRLL